MKKLFLLAFISFSLNSFAQSNIDQSFFQEVDQFLKTHVQNNKVNYQALQQDVTLPALVQKIASANIESLDKNSLQAFYINAYNLLVIQKAVKNYPLESVLNVNRFFDNKDQVVAGKRLSLNQLEKDLLLKEFNDARFHFVLVCGANGCPPITDFAYLPAQLNEQLDQQTRKAINDPNFIKVDNAQQTVALSQIFEWYVKDFGGSQASTLQFINKYRTEAISSDYKRSFYTYDWSLNQTSAGHTSDVVVELSNNSARYVVSAAVPKGTTETKWFNNLYTQQTGNGESLTDRATFLTSSLSFLYGVTNRFNAGFDLRYRRVSYAGLPSSSIEVLGSPNDATNRQGFTNIGPKIRWAPFEALPNFSVQSAFWIPIGSDLEGNSEVPYIDWDGSTWVTQVFNDFSIGSSFSLFTEISFWYEDIGDENDLNRFSTPATVIFSYFPNPKTTLYALSNYSPFWQKDFDYFAQAGFGVKYQITPNFEVEGLYTAFTNEFLQDINGRASTFNIGIRINR